MPIDDLDREPTEQELRQMEEEEHFHTCPVCGEDFSCFCLVPDLEYVVCERCEE